MIRRFAGRHSARQKRTPDGATEVLVDADVDDEHVEPFQQMWPSALQLKELAEK